MRFSNSTFSGLLASWAGKFWGAFLSIAVVPIYLRELGADGFGLVGFYSSLLMVFMVFDFGLSATINRALAFDSAKPETNRKEKNSLGVILRTLESAYFFIAALAGIVLFLSSEFIGRHWLTASLITVDETIRCIQLMSFALIGQFLIGFYSGALTGLQRQIELNIVLIFIATIRYIGSVIVILFYSIDLTVFFSWQALSSVIGFSVIYFLTWSCVSYKGIKPRFSIEILKTNFKFSFGMTLVSVVSIGILQIDRLVVSKFSTLEVFGYYSLAGTVAGALLYLSQPVFSVFSPKFTAAVAGNNQNEIARLYHQSSRLLVTLIAPACIVISSYSSELLLLWTGDESASLSAGSILQWLILGSAVGCLMSIPFALQLAHAWTTLTLYSNTLVLIFLIPSAFYAGQYYGPDKVALTLAVFLILQSVGNVLYMHSKILRGELYTWLLMDVGLPVFFAALTFYTTKFFISSIVKDIEVIKIIGFTLLITQFSIVAFYFITNNFRDNSMLVRK